MSDKMIIAHNEIMGAFMKLDDLELNKAYAELDSVANLNGDPSAVRSAGHRAARLAFTLGVKYAEAVHVHCSIKS